MSGSLNDESYSTLRWVLENAERGFYMYTATPPMQRRVAEYYGEPAIAVYDYSKNSAPYSFGALGQWAKGQKSRAFFVINMQIALREEKDIINLNLSRDLLAGIGGIWIFAMTPDAEERLVQIAHDFYSFIRLQAHFEDEGIENETLQPIVSTITSGKYYDSYAEAAEQMERYAGLGEELMALPLNAGPERLLSAAITLENIAELYRTYGHYGDAMKLLMRIKDIREKEIGVEHLDTAITYSSIAMVYDMQGGYAEALKWHHQALAIREKILGMEHTDTATTYNDIAGIYQRLGDYEQALSWYHKALAIREKILGTEHPFTAITYNNMALVYARQNDYPLALSWYHKALAIQEKILGREHPDTAATYFNMAEVYDRQGDHTQALSWYNKAADIFAKVLGPNHPHTGIIQEKLTRSSTASFEF